MTTKFKNCSFTNTNNGSCDNVQSMKKEFLLSFGVPYAYPNESKNSHYHDYRCLYS